MKLSNLKPFVPTKDLFFPFRNTALDNFFNDASEDAESFFKPGANILETDSAFKIQLALPGLKKEEVKIDLRDNTLTISGERNSQKEEKEGTWHYSEIRQGKFSRSFIIPETVSQDDIEANFSDGMLELNLPKMEPKKAKAIAIK